MYRNSHVWASWPNFRIFEFCVFFFASWRVEISFSHLRESRFLFHIFVSYAFFFASSFILPSFSHLHFSYFLFHIFCVRCFFFAFIRIIKLFVLKFTSLDFELSFSHLRAPSSPPEVPKCEFRDESTPCFLFHIFRISTSPKMWILGHNLY